MGQILHGSTRTTKAVRRTIQHSQESMNVLAKQYGINPKPYPGGANVTLSMMRRWDSR